MDLDSHADVPPACAECGKGNDVKMVQFRVPGKAHDFDSSPEGRKRLCGKCRKKPKYKGRFRIVEGWG